MNEEKKKVLPCIALCEGDIHPRVLTCGEDASLGRLAGDLMRSNIWFFIWD